VTIEFSSKAPRSCRLALEELLFFNPAQANDAESIMRSIERFGRPKIVEIGDQLTVSLTHLEAQTLFAFDRDRANPAPIGVAIFTRTAPDEFSIVQIAVDPGYAQQSRLAGLGLGAAFVRQIRAIAARITGVRWIVSFYRQNIRVPVLVR